MFLIAGPLIGRKIHNKYYKDLDKTDVKINESRKLLQNLTSPKKPLQKETQKQNGMADFSQITPMTIEKQIDLSPQDLPLFPEEPISVKIFVEFLDYFGLFFTNF